MRTRIGNQSVRLHVGWQLAVAFTAAGAASAQSVTTDRTDYVGGSIVEIAGRGYAANEELTARVCHFTSEPACSAQEGSHAHHPWFITTDENGGFRTQWTLPPDDSETSTYLLSALRPDGSGGQSLFSQGCNLGLGRVTSVVPVDGGCVSGPTGNNVQAYDVQQGKTYTITLQNVTDCANGGTDATIGVMVKNSNTGNLCYTATKVAVGVYTFDHTMPANACFTSPIDYCVEGCNPSTGLRARRGDGACAQVHLRAATFGVDCTNPVEDSDCEGGTGKDPGEGFCFGDGSMETVCPCAEPDTVPNPAAATGHGCANSFDLDGALLTASGTIVPDTIRFTCTIGPNYGGFAFMVVGNGAIANGEPNGDGIKCVTRVAAGHMYRFGGHAAGTNGDPLGTWSYPNTAQTISVSTVVPQPAGTAYYQLYYRHLTPGFCNPSLANFSNGYKLVWP